MKRRILLPVLLSALLVFPCAQADPAKTDGTVTAWIGEENEMFLKCSDGVTRKLPAPMKDILGMTENEAIGLTQANQMVAVKKDGTGYSVLSADATEQEIAFQAELPFELTEEGRLSVGETVLSERAAAAVTDGLVLYWVNKSDNGYVLMEKDMPGREEEAAGRNSVSLTGRSVPEPLYLSLTEEALTLTDTDHSVTAFSLKTGEAFTFPASGQDTAAACMADDRLYRYTRDETGTWTLEEIRNDAMQLVTVTPAPTATPSPTPTPTPTPRPTAAPTATPKGGSSGGSVDNNIYKGAKGKTVRKIQQRLAELGYPVGAADGVYGEQTHKAVRLFYDMTHMKERSCITPAMQGVLFSVNAPVYDPYMPLQKGDSGLCVQYMQRKLIRLGYDPGKPDGIYGEKTVKAVAEYQKSIGYQYAEKEKPGEYASRELLEELIGPATPTDL